MTGLDRTRQRLEAIDDQLLTLLHERWHLVATLWEAKAEARVPRHDPDREAAVLARLREAARTRGLDPEAVQAVFEAVVGVDFGA